MHNLENQATIKCLKFLNIHLHTDDICIAKHCNKLLITQAQWLQYIKQIFLCTLSTGTKAEIAVSSLQSVSSPLFSGIISIKYSPMQ